MILKDFLAAIKDSEYIHILKYMDDDWLDRITVKELKNKEFFKEIEEKEIASIEIDVDNEWSGEGVKDILVPFFIVDFKGE